MRLIGARAALRVPVLAGMVSLVGVGIVDVASYPLSLDLGGGAAGYGAMTALLGGGGLVGAALAARVSRGTGAGARVSFAAGGAGLALAGAAPVLAVALAGMAVAGSGRGLGDVAHGDADPGARGRRRPRPRLRGAGRGRARRVLGLRVHRRPARELAGARGAFAVAAALGVGAALIAARAGPRRLRGGRERRELCEAEVALLRSTHGGQRIGLDVLEVGAEALAAGDPAVLECEQRALAHLALAQARPAVALENSSASFVEAKKTPSWPSPTHIGLPIPRAR